MKAVAAVDADVARTVELIPDESITDAIGRGHTLASAVADIIDNSLDAQADSINVRFVTEDDRVVAVRIRDNGSGMTPEGLQDAMTLAKRRDYAAGSLSQFGLGLKAASLSQAATLTVITREHLSGVCAMRIRRGSFTADVLESLAASAGYELDVSGPASTGTIVEWTGLETVSHSRVRAVRLAWLEHTITELSGTLGLTFHRLIEHLGVRITIDSWDRPTHVAGIRRTVEPRDPFAFSVSGHSDYPAWIIGTTSDDARVAMECHILPPRSESASMRLLGKQPEEWQGLYVYRNDRLLLAGGWLDIRPKDKRLRLARMRLDLPLALEPHLRVRHEKSGVTATPEFIGALESAVGDNGITLDRFREDAKEVFRTSNKRRRRAHPVVGIRAGLPEQVLQAVRLEMGVREDIEPIDVVWQGLDEERLFAMDLDQRRLILNLAYRDALGPRGGALASTLVYLLLESNFTRQHLQQVTLDQIEAWQRVAAVAMGAGGEARDLLSDWDHPVVDFVFTPATVQVVPETTSVEGLTGQVAPETTSEEPLTDSERIGPPMASVPGSRDRAQSPGREAAEVFSSGLRKSGVIRAGDRELVGMYRRRTDLDTIAITLGVETRDVVTRLGALLLDLEGDDIDDESLAALYGEPYTPEDRERIVERFSRGEPVRAIADHYYRTPLAIAWQLLASPKRPVDVPKNLARRISRELESLAGAPNDVTGASPVAN